MMYWNGDWNWAAWSLMTVTMIAFWALVIWGVVFVARQATGDRSPQRILDERFARGEIDDEEYRRRNDALGGQA